MRHPSDALAGRAEPGSLSVRIPRATTQLPSVVRFWRWAVGGTVLVALFALLLGWIGFMLPPLLGPLLLWWALCGLGALYTWSQVHTTELQVASGTLTLVHHGGTTVSERLPIATLRSVHEVDGQLRLVLDDEDRFVLEAGDAELIPSRRLTSAGAAPATGPSR